jgi:ferredoxin
MSAAPQLGNDGRQVIPVRFINTPSGEDVVVGARPGEVLLNVADKGGVAMARGCKTGLCGACTCDLKDPSWTAAAHLVAETGGREGFQTVRSCSTRVTLLPGQDEFVVDVFRSLAAGKRRALRAA